MAIGKLIVQPMGGLANRMRVIGALRQVALQASVPFEVRWVNNTDCGAGWKDLFEIPSDFTVQELLPPKHSGYSHEYYSKKWYKNIPHQLWALRHGYLWFPYNIVEQMEEDTSPEGLERLFSNWIRLLQRGKMLYISTGDWLGDDYDSSFFKPIQSLLYEINRFYTHTHTHTHTQVALYGIHIRRTDNTWAIENSPLSLFEKRIEKILKNEPNALFYLASDDAGTIAHIKNRYGDCILTRNKTFGRTSVEGMQDAVIEMWLLSKTKKIVGSYYSSYSDMAAKIGNVELEIIKNDEMIR